MKNYYGVHENLEEILYELEYYVTCITNLKEKYTAFNKEYYPNYSYLDNDIEKELLRFKDGENADKTLQHILAGLKSVTEETIENVISDLKDCWDKVDTIQSIFKGKKATEEFIESIIKRRKKFEFSSESNPDITTSNVINEESLSALLLAKGIGGGDLSKCCVIDTENSINLYSHIGNFHILSLSQPFSPENYIKAISACEDAGFETIIIDSISHCWHYLLQLHGSMQGNSFTNWSKITPLHNNFIQKIQQSPCHIITTIRSKQDYLIQTQNGKTSIEKVGLKGIQRQDVEYEFTTMLDLNIAHQARAVKDRTGLFTDKDIFTITEDTGSKILDYCRNGVKVDDIKSEISKTATIEQLTEIYKLYPTMYNMLSGDFEQQKEKIYHNTNQIQNGVNANYPTS
jgi:hypothetical protein